MKQFGRWIKRLFTHPYGACEEEGCDRPRRRWMLFCEHHHMKQLIQAMRENEQREFDRKADIIAEGIRRASNYGVK